MVENYPEGLGTFRSTLNRRAKILQLLEQEGKVSVPELSEKFNVSAVTIRNDLVKLEQNGLLIRVRGGAIKEKKELQDYLLQDEGKENYREKLAIAKKAAQFIKDGESLFLGAGSTILIFAKQLSLNQKTVKIITYSLPIVEEFKDDWATEVILLGGVLRRKNLSLAGPLTEQNLANFSYDKIFLEVSGVDLDNNIYCQDIEEASIIKSVVELGTEVIILADHTKFLRKSFYKMPVLDKVHTIITDSKVDRDMVSKLQSATNIKVIVANK